MKTKHFQMNIKSVTRRVNGCLLQEKLFGNGGVWKVATAIFQDLFHLWDGLRIRSKQMKEVTEWNGKPRWMWCWDNEGCKEKHYVVCVLAKEQMKEVSTAYPVCTCDAVSYKHCAEIEEEKRPCTREELIEMLKKQGVSMLIFKDSGFLHCVLKITRDEVTFISESGCFSYTYEQLCNRFTLLDGTKLWVEE